MTPDSSDTSSAPDVIAAPEENPYYVLRRGEILGPFDIEQLQELVKGGMLEYDDFVQQAGNPEWLPVRWLLIPEEAQDLEGALAPTWRTLIKWAWLRLRYNLDEQSLSSGWVCLGLAMAGLFLSRWPMLLWAPWAILAFFGGVALYRRDRPGSGISLMLSAALIPGALWAYFWASSTPVKEAEKPAIPSPTPAMVSAHTPAPTPLAHTALTPAPFVELVPELPPPPPEIKAPALEQPSPPPVEHPKSSTELTPVPQPSPTTPEPLPG